MKHFNKLHLFFLLTLTFGVNSIWGQTTFNYTGTIQTYIVPPGVNSIQILVNGAQGGDATPLFGGLGATMQGDFAVTPGQQIDILVGEQPNSNGGGGGTFVVENGTNTPLIIAGGGGGAAGECCGAQADGMPGVSTQDGTAGNNVGCTTGVAGIAGNGGTGGDPAAYGSGGGSGFLTNGGDGVTPGNGGMSYLNGGAGGIGSDGNGGYGGGGGSEQNGGYNFGSGGGGGGYSGGAGNCGSSQWGNGGAGGSYNVGTSPINTTGNNVGNGSVTITQLCTGLTVTVSDTIVCDNEELILDATSLTGGSITWDNGATDGVAFTPLTTGVITYTAISSDVNDCFLSVNITVLQSPVVTSVSTDEILGSDGTIDITVTGGVMPYVFDWDNDGTGDLDDTEDLTGLLAGTYTVSVVDSLGCISTNPIVVNSQLGIEDVDDTNIIVFPNPTTDNIYLNVIGGFSYQLISIEGEIISEGIAINNKTISLKDLANGTYIIKISSTEINKTLKVIKN